MRNVSPFDHRPDRQLGKALRELLTPSDHRAFVEQVVANARREFERGAAPGLWEVLGAWMRPGLAAALALALAALVGIRSNGSVELVTIDDELSASATSAEQSLLLAPTPPDVDVVLVSAYEN